MSAPTTCKSCGAAVVFERHVTSGKFMIFDHPPRKAWTITPGVGARHVEVYEPHHARCPHAAEHRKEHA